GQRRPIRPPEHRNRGQRYLWLDRFECAHVVFDDHQGIPKRGDLSRIFNTFLSVPGTPGTADAPDWNEPACILVDIHANADESGTATFHYKTNAPGSNGAPTLDGMSGQYFNASPTNGPVGQLGSVTGAIILGTWTVTLNQD